MRYVTPIGSLLRGLAAGAVGSAVQSSFFKATARIAPETPKDAFLPPEPQQASERSVQTVARRFSEGLMVRGPLAPSQKEAGGQIVHFAFGAGWGGLWGLTRESYPALAGPAGVAGFSAAVWMLADNAILPLFRLAAPPQAYPARTHAYALAAHLAYGLAVVASYEAMRRPFWRYLGVAAWTLGARRAIRKKLPTRVQPVARKAIGVAAFFKARRPLTRAAALVGASA